MGKISIIIPVYNVEKYLEECLDSVLNQTLKDIKIICINDGSTDRSGDILEKYRTMDDRINVIKQENRGLSATRNCGMQYADGEFVLFLDSDDFLAQNDALEKLYTKAASENLDQLFFGTEVYFENDLVKRENSRYIDYYRLNKDYPSVYLGKELFVLLTKNSDFKVNACMQLFRNDFLRENHLMFCEGIQHEDEVFTVQCISVAKRVSVLSEKLFGRRIREGSIMTAKKKEKSIFGYCQGIDCLCEFAKEKKLYEDSRFFEQYKKRLCVLFDLASRLYREMDDNERKDVVDLFSDEMRIWFEVGLEQSKRVEDLKEKVAGIKKEIQDLQNLKRLLQDENKKLQSENTDLKNENKLVKQEHKEYKRKNEQLKIENDSLEKRIDGITNSHSFKVGKTITYIPRKLKQLRK